MVRYFLPLPCLLIALLAPLAASPVTIDNGLVTASFRDGDFGLEPLTGSGINLEFDPTTPLWLITLYDSDLPELTSDDLETITSQQGGQCGSVFSANGDTLTLAWLDVDLAGQGELDVWFRILLPAGCERLRCELELALDADRHALWSITAPCMALLTEGVELPIDCAVVPTHAGCRVADPAVNLHLGLSHAADLDPTASVHNVTHPGGIAIQQYHLYNQALRAGLLYGTEDAAGWLKRIGTVGTGNAVSIAFRHFPAQDGASSVTWRQPYPVYLKPFAGDWIDAARDYRQRIEGLPWLEAGPLYQRPDGRRQALGKSLSLTCQLGFMPEYLSEARARLLEVAEFLGPDVAASSHGRNWGWHPFCWEPGWSIEPHVLAMFSLADSLGLGCAPYTSTRDLREDMLPWYDENWTARTYNGEWCYSTEFHAYVQCPGSGWRDHYPLRLQELLSVDGVTDLYCDNYPKPALCHHPEHEHPPGGGTYWLDGYRGVLGEVRDAWPEASLTNESRCELLLPWLDLFPTHPWDQNDPGWFALATGEPVPLIEAVYHDRVQMYGTVLDTYAEQDSLAFRFKQAWGWTGGTLLSLPVDGEAEGGWSGDRHRSYAFLRQLAALAGNTREYYTFGRWERPPALTGFGGTVTVPFEAGTGGHEFWTGSPVLGGCLVSPRDRLGVYLANFTTEARGGTVTIDLDDLGVGPGPWRVWRLDANLVWTELADHHGDVFNTSVELEPLSAVVLRLLAPGETGVGQDEGLPQPTQHLQAWPNPFSGRLQLALEGGDKLVSDTNLAVYDLHGRRVRTLQSETGPVPPEAWLWDGRNDAGRPLAAGAYFVRAEAAGMIPVTTKILLLR